MKRKTVRFECTRYSLHCDWFVVSEVVEVSCGNAADKLWPQLSERTEAMLVFSNFPTKNRLLVKFGSCLNDATIRFPGSKRDWDMTMYSRLGEAMGEALDVRQGYVGVEAGGKTLKLITEKEFRSA